MSGERPVFSSPDSPSRQGQGRFIHNQSELCELLFKVVGIIKDLTALFTLKPSHSLGEKGGGIDMVHYSCSKLSAVFMHESWAETY